MVLSMYYKVMYRSFWACNSYELAHLKLTGSTIVSHVLKIIVHTYYHLAN
jgi:hypothetical protein